MDYEFLFYVVFEANRDEMEYVVRKSGPVPNATSGDGVLRMRGLPFGCSKEEIVQFFMGMFLHYIFLSLLVSL